MMQLPLQRWLSTEPILANAYMHGDVLSTLTLVQYPVVILSNNRVHCGFIL